MDLKVIDEYNALSLDAKQDLELNDFFVFPVVGYVYDVEINPKINFKKRLNGVMTYWSLDVMFIGDSFKYCEKHKSPVIDLPVMGNEVLVLGKMLASKIRVLMEKYYDRDIITIRFKRITSRTSVVELL